MSNILIDRFLRYVKIDTESNPKSTSTPTSKNQFDLANVLVEELKSVGMSNVTIDEKCYVMAELPANTEGVPTIGFVAHVDTSPDFSGANVKPQIVKNYQGGDILLNEKENIVLSVEHFPEVEKYIGQDIITTDGTTLLGADDKAGIAEIITAIEHLVQNPDIKHGTVKVCFTPDEEVGQGADYFDVEKFGADWAYTIDGGEIGELEYENFNAASAIVSVEGRIVHPGFAKDKMINSQHIAMEFHSMLPAGERPEHTTGYEGFFHLMNFDGNVDNSELTYIVRDHSREKFEARKLLVQDVLKELNAKYNNCLTLKLTDSYYNMREKVEPVYHIVELAERAMIDCKVKPIIKPIRGGTDGARLSFMGLPTPNIFGGGHNFHGRFEFIPIQSMEKTVKVIVRILQLAAEK